MALDAVAVSCLVKEISDKVIGGRIDKVHQPERDEIVIHIRTMEGNYNLVISADASHPRFHFSDKQKQNPITPPMFCMLLRKHLGSGKIISINQIGFERVVSFDIESRNELGDLTVKHLIVEIMGRHSNIILTNEEMKIIDSVKHIDFSVSTVRQVLPGMEYVCPPPQNKIPLNEFDGNFSFDVPDGTMLSKALLSCVSGISPLTAREIVYKAYGNDMALAEVDDFALLSESVYKVAETVKNGDFAPCIIKDNNALKITDFSAIDIKQYGNLMEIVPYKSMNAVIDEFYSTRDALERMKQKSSDIVKLMNNLLERAYKKRIVLRQTIADAENKEKYKIYGDLITSNLYKINQGDKSVVVQNYYESDCPEVKIPLNPMYTPSQNAQQYYKKYRKAKTAEVEAALWEKQNEEVIEYLESTLVSVSNCTTEADINAIRTELASEGYLKKTNNKKNKQVSVSKPMHFVSVDGFDIYVGKNNTQNDYLTLRFANSGDIWFHTKLIHGSHTIIKLGIDKDVPETTLRQAAELAAYYSKGRESNQVPVDYTQIKNVKKPSGAKPGMVIYDNYNTVYVTPKIYEESKS